MLHLDFEKDIKTLEKAVYSGSLNNNLNNSNYLSVSSFMELTSVITEYILKTQPEYKFKKIRS